MRTDRVTGPKQTWLEENQTRAVEFSRNNHTTRTSPENPQKDSRSLFRRRCVCVSALLCLHISSSPEHSPNRRPFENALPPRGEEPACPGKPPAFTAPAHRAAPRAYPTQEALRPVTRRRCLQNVVRFRVGLNRRSPRRPTATRRSLVIGDGDVKSARHPMARPVSLIPSVPEILPRPLALQTSACRIFRGPPYDGPRLVTASRRAPRPWPEKRSRGD